MRNIIAILFTCFAVTGCANHSAQKTDAVAPPCAKDSVVRNAFDDVSASEKRKEDGSVAVALNDDITVLSKALEKRNADKVCTIYMHYYRARARKALVGVDHYANHKPFDEAAAREAIQEFDQTISLIDAKGDPSQSIVKSNARYAAGLIAYNFLKDGAQAYRYWSACADEGHAGCINCMAWGYTTGDAGLPVDLDKAVEFHKRVAATGIQYTCAGAYSAESIALLIALAGVNAPGERAEDWTNRALSLLDELDKFDQTSPARNLCHREMLLVDIYLMNLAKGTKRPELLSQAVSLPGSARTAPAISYLQSRITDTDYLAQINALDTPDLQCSLAFYGLWLAEIRGNRTHANPYNRIIQQTQACRTERVLTRHFRTIQGD